MRTLNQQSLDQIAKTHGTEPINLVGIEWVDGTVTWYSDKELTGAHPAIMELSEIDEVLKIDTGSPTFEVSVTLDDSDGAILNQLNTINLQKRKCYISQTFEGLALADSFLIFQGEAVTPIVWDECNRTLKFNVLSEIDSREVGFSPEEDQLEFVTDDAVGRVWPLCFGDVVHVPATKSSSILNTTTTTEVGFGDITLLIKRAELFTRVVGYLSFLGYLESRIDDAQLMSREPLDIHNDYIELLLEEDIKKQEAADKSKEISDLIDQISGEGLTGTDLAAKKLERVDRQEELKTLSDELSRLETGKFILEVELDNAEYRFETIDNIRAKILEVKEAFYTTNIELGRVNQAVAEQDNLVSNTVKILNGNNFPQNTQIDLEIKGMIVRGILVDDTFTISEYLPRYSDIEVAPRENDDPNSFWLVDGSIDLSNHYLLTAQGVILKVERQVGNRCFVEVEDAIVNPTEEEESVPKTELDFSTWARLENATELTDQEKDRVLEQALGDEPNGSRLLALRDDILGRVESLRDNMDDLDANEINTVRSLLFKDMFKYNVIASRFTIPLSAQQKVNQKISKEEEEFLLRAENLYQFQEIRDNRLFGITIDTDYRNGFAASAGIVAASPTIFASWLGVVAIDDLPPSTLWVAEPGSTVTLASDSSELYIANTLPSEVQAVYAKRSIDGIIRLVPVPSDYYTVNESHSILNMNTTSITLNRPLDTYFEENWVNGLYVTLKSSEGPNTADIIKHIVENYTNLTVDTETYQLVRGYLEKYPSNFALLDKRDALALVEDIAWQARCVVYVKSGILFFRYLSVEPDPVKFLNYDDIEQETLTVEYTDTDDIYTKLTGLWKPHYDVEDDNQSIVRHNIARYGSIEFEREFFIYNIQSLVEKSLTFWAIRYSNSWKRVKFKTFLTNLELEAWDAISLNLTDIGWSDVPVIALVEESIYDSSDMSLTLTCWAPLRAGSLEAYPYAFPANLPVMTIFPTEEDVAGGNAGNPNNYPNGSNGNSGGVGPLQIRPRDFGGQFPSDSSDDIPVSPISGFEPVNYRTFNININKLPRKQLLDVLTDQTWGFNVTLRKPRLLSKEPFKGFISEVVDSTLGQYVVTNMDGRSIEVNYQNSPVPLEVDQRVFCIYDNFTYQWDITTIDKEEHLVEVVSVEFDLITCKLRDAPDGDTFKILKPYGLRREPFNDGPHNGINYTYNSPTNRTATSDTTTEVQIITPDYVAGDILVLQKVSQAVEVDDMLYRWQDKNVDSRAWAVDFG